MAKFKVGDHSNPRSDEDDTIIDDIDDIIRKQNEGDWYVKWEKVVLARQNWSRELVQKPGDEDGKV